MKIKFTAASLFLAVSSLMAAYAGERIVENINFDWRFMPGDPANAESIQYDDSDWQTVNLPHDFQISQPWVAPAADEKADLNNSVANIQSRLSARGFKEMGTGWYRYDLKANPDWKGKRVLLDFGGIMLVGDVYFNGKRVGGTDYGYVGFEVDITKLIDYDGPNVIAVRADTGGPDNSRWYTGAGINRMVKVVVTDPQTYFMRHPLYITTPVVEPDRAIVRLQAEIAALKHKGATLPVHTVINDTDGTTVYDKTTHLPFNRKMRTCEYLVDSLEILNPRLWDLDTPHLYSIEMSILDENGNVIDKVDDTFGVRKIEYSPEFGFKLNGKKVLFQGLSGHNSYGAVGSAAFPRSIEKQIQLLKENGFNEIRCAHNPYSEDMLDLCDKYGILVVDELYDKWLQQYAGGRRDWMELWPRDVPEWVKRDRNHPCVVMWSLGNELQTLWKIPFADWGVTPYRLQKTLLNRYDKTRPITVAMHPRGRNLETDSLPADLARETDIAAYNFRYMYFPGDHRRFPDMIFFQSEANLSNMGPNFFDMDRNSVVGLSYWGMIDYIGESTGWPAKGWTQGVFDLSLEPKPMSYFLRSFFKPDEPLVHISVIEKAGEERMWNDAKIGHDEQTDHWNRPKGSKYDIYTYTNGDEVELILNGHSLGRMPNDTVNSQVRNRILWKDIAYEPGALEALAYRTGEKKPIARHRIETTGKMRKLELTGDNPDWKADGMDLQHVRIVALDNKNRHVAPEDTPLHFEVDGPAEIIGVVNGDMTSEESLVGDTRRLYNGRASVILRSKRRSGPVVLTVTPEGGKPVKYTMATK
ncbi:MAG: DUF4982 domain-containing protein [Muribaculaceae bacterium]|nr:DUF4982 domain-containing protein [Muribaculaceae bacterium]